ncbi:phospho-sugar mutase [Rhodococcus rhodnii]|uniref:Phosphoglucomutase n=2 Tax=Rhodococcus rhodnii TaxID=38312 RepID=R7WJH1_9NOCA|nr:phospho-sugar mutase [Rhodococcus rhodnii]EOM75437.1 phosphoglucomutase [Rhodococcus rhodnii LMG 5362]TXG90536.1 phospho-sugar mutase [Rhodococcus rhodnii]
MNDSTFRRDVERWIAADPDPADAAALRAASPAELTEWFAQPLAFGTAGLRGPLRPGPAGMNLAVVLRASAGLAQHLAATHPHGEPIVVGHDARHRSREFAHAAAEVFAGAGFEVVLLPRALPTPVVAYAVRTLGAAAGVQITASHNPAGDNGYKVYVEGGAQLVSPADREIEAAIAGAGPTNRIPRTPVAVSDDAVVARYVARAASLVSAPHRSVRIALTTLHGVGGELGVATLRRAGFDDVHVVDEQFAPDPDFPTAPKPNPEEPGTTDALLALARRVDADLAIAFDPDADRCAVGIPTPDGWRMLRGDETGVLLAEHVLARTSEPDPLVATTIVSSTLLDVLAPARGARCARTLTGFKWLVRAGDGLVYAYEEALGMCVDPDAVRDKDGISAAVVAADLVATLRDRGETVASRLDDLAVEFGVYAADQVSLEARDRARITEVMTRWRTRPPDTLAGERVSTTDLAATEGSQRTDAVVLQGDSCRLVVRPSGTEPKIKFYLEVVEPTPSRAALTDARARARQRLAALRGEIG